MSEIKLTKKEMEESVTELECLVVELWALVYDSNKVEVKGLSRKEVLMGILIGGKLWSVKELSLEMGERVGKDISSRNVSSLLSYIRDEVEKNEVAKEKGKEVNKMYDGELKRIGRGVGKLKWVKTEVKK